MEPDPPSPTGIRSSAARRAMQQRADHQRVRLRPIPRHPTRRPICTGRQGQTTSVHAHRMREPAPAADHIAVGWRPRIAASIGTLPIVHGAPRQRRINMSERKRGRTHSHVIREWVSNITSRLHRNGITTHFAARMQMNERLQVVAYVRLTVNANTFTAARTSRPATDKCRSWAECCRTLREQINEGSCWVLGCNSSFAYSLRVLGLRGLGFGGYPKVSGSANL